MSRPLVETKLLALVGLILTLFVVLIAAVVPPANGYEASIYEVYPWYFWVSVVGVFLAGQLAILRSAHGDLEGDRTWLFGLAAMFLVSAILLLMPYIRGYPVYGRADVLTHIGFIKNISKQGFVEPSNIYPSTHLLVRILAFATESEPMQVINIIPAVVSVTYFGSMVLLLSQMFDRRRMFLFGLVFVSVPSLGTPHLLAVPFTHSMLLVPFVLYLFIREQRTNTLPVRIALVTAVISLVIYHPLTTLFLIAALAIYWVFKRTSRFADEYVGPTSSLSLLVAVFAAWYFTFPGIIFRIESILNAFLGEEESTSTLENYSSTISQTQPDLADILTLAVYKYGVEALTVALGVGFVLVAFLLWQRGRFSPNIYMLTFSAVVLTFTVGSVLFFTMDLIVGFGRPLLMAQILALPLAGAFWYLIWRFSRGVSDIGSTAFTGLLVILLVLFVSLSTFTVYYSPNTSQMNHQVTEMEVSGTEWLFENRNETIAIDEFGISQDRFYDLHYGTEGERPSIRDEETGPPEHFNYTVNRYAGESYASDSYLMLTKYGRITYQEKFPDYEEYWAYKPKDYERLEYDPTVSRTYDNGEFNSYLINGTKA